MSTPRVTQTFVENIKDGAAKVAIAPRVTEVFVEVIRSTTFVPITPRVSQVFVEVIRGIIPSTTWRPYFLSY